VISFSWAASAVSAVDAFLAVLRYDLLIKILQAGEHVDGGICDTYRCGLFLLIAPILVTQSNLKFSVDDDLETENFYSN